MKIPVYIWYKDISQEVIDTQVKNSIGLTVDTLSEDLPMPDATLLNEIKADNINAENNMQAYLAKTEKERAKEKENTDRFVQTRRGLSRKAYAEKSKQIKDIASINNSDVIFNSQYAPFIICELTEPQIKALEKDSRIESIGYYEEPIAAECTVESVKGTTGQSKLESLLGLTGDGVNVGMVDGGYPLADDELDLSEITMIGSPSYDGHATNTAKILKGEDSGFAKDINLYSTNGDFSNIELMLTAGVKIINVSFGWIYFESDTSSNYAYSYFDKWFDHIVAYHNVTVVASAGNNAQGSYYNNDPNKFYKRILSPAMAYNVITVGAYDDKGNTNNADDQLCDYSSYKNTNGTTTTRGIEKPDVVMPANLLGGGTSSSAPVLTAIISQLLELKPSLAAFPQAIKAIVLASCHRKVDSSTDNEAQETMGAGITERQGAGAPDAWTMACIVSQGTYGVDTMEGSETTAYHRFVLPEYGADKFNVSLAYLRNNICNGSASSTVGEKMDLDLYVYGQSNTLLGGSILYYSSTEMSYQPLSSGNDVYKLMITKDDDIYTETLRYGYAYSTNATYATPVTNEGIYYIKNRENGGYLSYDTTTGDVKVQSGSSGVSQQWIVRKVGSYYGVYPNYNSVSGYLSPIINSNSDIYYPRFSGVVPVMLFQSYETNPALDEGSFTLLTQGENYSYALSYFNNSAVFRKCVNTSTYLDNMQWTLEKVHYRRGDFDADGMLSSTDATAIQLYLSQLGSINNQSEFLSDADYDGTVSVFDVTKVQRILAELDIY
ncbi:MAG: hypothetical protein E7513_02615 [Ruminococcaceae bacterium]|nr:hypothetical protein [Oscillospiraceae bacterium]